MNRSYLCLRVRTYISPYRGSICYKRRTSPFQNINIGPQEDIEKGAKRVYLPLQYFGMYHGSIYSLKKKKKEFCISGEQIGVGKSERGGYEPSLVVVPGPPISSFPFARPGEIRFLERSEVIGREDCWREIPIHESSL